MLLLVFCSDIMFFLEGGGGINKSNKWELAKKNSAYKDTFICSRPRKLQENSKVKDVE